MQAGMYDIVVLGSGIAGLTFALHAAANASVAVLCKAALSDTNTAYAQGGIAAVFSLDDSLEQHVQDTLIAGVGLCQEEAVRYMVEQAPESIAWLQQQGVCFDTLPDNRMLLGLEGGHSQHRIVHVKDSTGYYVQQALGQQVRQHQHIQLHEFQMGIELLVTEETDGKKCRGVKVLDLKTGELTIIYAKAIVLATGGSGQIYLHTTNPAIATGDGLAMAARAGAAIQHMEFFQFHPTALYEPEAKDTFLISEALRGAGAELVLPDGSSFMHAYHGQGSLAPRDVVARAVYHEMNYYGVPCLYLDATRLPAGELRARFPLIFAKCMSIGIQPEHELIPIVPAAHYQCGGVQTDKFGQTSIPGLYAIGEVGCTGVHGANRLASNSLLEALVLGKSAAEHALSFIKDQSFIELHLPVAVPEILPTTISAKVESIKTALRCFIWENVGIERTTINLELAQLELLTFKDDLLNSESTAQVIEVQNLITVAELMINACLKRKESLGGHFIRNDVPVQGEFI